MGRNSKKLSALEVNRLSAPGKYPLGESLYLQISAKGAKSWLFRYSVSGKTSWMGLGSLKLVNLAEAREKVHEGRKGLLSGVNPIEKRNAAKSQSLLEVAKKITFDKCSEQYIEAHSRAWKNQKHIDQWKSTLLSYASPVVGNISVNDIDTDLVLKILEPIWYVKSETATRLRGRIERILSWAAVRGYRPIENPARWRGHLDQLLPRRSSIQQVEHFKALPFIEMGDFMRKLRSHDGISPLALEFAILTATRTNETLGARWSEFDIEEKYWLIPKERMKAKKEHKVPLASRTIEILGKMKRFSSGEFVFPGAKHDRSLSNMALLMMIRRLGYNVTTHGFRSAFSDWAAERTSFPREVVEMALAHTVKNKVEAAYRRGDLFLKRQLLMATWGEHCSAEQIIGSLHELKFRPVESDQGTKSLQVQV